MKEILQLMARYSRHANLQLFDILKSLPEKSLSEPRGSYFDNLLGLLNHLLVADLGWLSAYRDSLPQLESLKNPALDVEHPGWGKILHHDLASLIAHQEKMDQIFIDLTEEVSTEEFEGNITLKRSNGESREFPFGKVLMHLLNHHTHHRGAITQILDEMDVENDFSNLMALLS